MWLVIFADGVALPLAFSVPRDGGTPLDARTCRLAGLRIWDRCMVEQHVEQQQGQLQVAVELGPGLGDIPA